MTKPSDFIDFIRFGRPDLNQDLLLKAYEYARQAHMGQKRKSGEDYFIHPLEVAKTLAQMNFDIVTVIAGLFHDLLEDTSVSYEDIQKNFGKDVADLVEGMTKIDFATSKHVSGYQSNLHKFTLSFSQDIRVLCIKLADRLHNMQTIHYLSAPKQLFKAKETFELYMPLAEKMGMYKLRDSLADASLKILEPQQFQSIEKNLTDLYEKSIDQINYIIHNINSAINGSKQYLISGRIKSIYSIWKKMKEKNIHFDQISDIMGFRIITETDMECYEILGKLHTKFNVIFNRFKDYISVPKSNNYKSLHTVIMMPKVGKIEIQIRTSEMHFASQSGVSSHWRYKMEGSMYEGIQQNEWMKNMLDIAQVSENSSQFLENIKMELMMNEIHCFTPKNQMITLKKGATPLDFAYAIHTDIGNSAVRAFVNGQEVLLISKLNNGDVVEIVTQPDRKTVVSWAKYVKSGKARAHILKNRIVLKEQKAEEVFKVKLAEKNIKYSENNLFRLLKHYNVHSKEVLFQKIEQNIIPMNDCIKFYQLETKKENKTHIMKIIPDSHDSLSSIIQDIEMRIGKICHVHIDHHGHYYLEVYKSLVKKVSN